MKTFLIKIDKADHLIHIAKIKSPGGTEPTTYRDCFLYVEAGKGLRNLKSPGNTYLGDTIGRHTRNIQPVKLDFTFVVVNAGNEIEYGGFTSSIGSCNAEYLPFLYFKTQIVYCFQFTETFGHTNGIEHHLLLRFYNNFFITAGRHWDNGSNLWKRCSP